MAFFKLNIVFNHIRFRLLILLSVFIIHPFTANCQNNTSIDSRKVQQLSGLCKVWGLLKYYHPTIQTGKIDWDTTLISYIPKVLAVNNNNEYNKIINEFILLPGEVKKLSKLYKYLPKDTSYNNFDYKWINNKTLFSDENSKLLFQVIENYKPQDNVYLKKELNFYYEGFNVCIPCNINTYQPDSSHALLALFRYWNVINYFFAYKNITDENWNDVLIEFIPKILESCGSIKYYLTLAELTTKINDCHAIIENSAFQNELGNTFPIGVKFIENKTVITKIPKNLSKNSKVNIGDIILAVDSIDINEKRKEVKKYCGCSHELSVNREIDINILRLKKSEIELTVLDSNNNIRSVFFSEEMLHSIDLTYDTSSINRQKYTFWYLLPNNIGYANLVSMTRQDIKKSIKDFQDTKGIIFDLRNNAYAPLFDIALRLPTNGHKNNVFARYYTGNQKYPGTFKPSRTREFDMGLGFFHKKYKGKVVFLINENVQSTYEWQVMSLKTSFNITFIGNNTSGTDGPAQSFLIQNNFLTYFTGDAIFNPDGSQTQRVGIKPDIYSTPTIKGIREEKDDVLNRAIEFINTGK